MNRMKKHIIFLILMLVGGTLSAGHWTPVSASYAYNMTMTGVVQLYGIEQQTAALEVGVFCGDECRGSQQLEYFAPAQRYIVWLTVYGNEGDEFTFKLYNHDSCEELELGLEETLAFSTDGYGSLSNPYLMNFKAAASSSSESQCVDVPILLIQGWNWISCLLTEVMPIEEALVNLVPNNGDMIKGQGGNSTYDFATGTWVGSLRLMIPGEGYIYLRNGGTTTFVYP